VLKQQALLAIDLGLAVNVHSRSAGHHAIGLVSELGVTKALFHAFDGKPKYAVAAHEQHGYMFSVAPCICRSLNLQALAQKLPLSALVLETDCPALVSNSTTIYYLYNHTPQSTDALYARNDGTIEALYRNIERSKPAGISSIHMR
jgi:Tat protein secretion system quality control protein TatD with DNase activity